MWHSIRSLFRTPSNKAPRATRPSRPRASHPLTVEALEDRTVPSTVTWINSAGGDWDTPTNWSTGTVPGAADDVVINIPGQNTFTVTHAAPTSDSVHSLTSQDAITLSEGSLSLATTSTINNTLTLSAALTVAGDLAVVDSFNWQSGTLNGPGSVTADQAATLQGGAIQGATLHLLGATQWDGGTLTLAAGAVLDNQGTLTMEYDAALTHNTSDLSVLFTNSGTVQVMNDTEVGLRAPTVSTGAITVQSGYLYMGGYDASTSTFSGSLTAAAGSLVQIDNAGGFIAFTSSSSIDAGDVVFDGGGTYTIAGSYQASGSTTLYAGAIAVHLSGTVGNLGALSLTPGTVLDLTGAHLGTGAASLPSLVLDGALIAPQALDVTGQLTFGGRLNGPGSLTADGTATLGGGALQGATLHLLGATQWDGGTLTLAAGAVLDNQGTLTMEYDAALTHNTSDLSVLFTNSGTVQVMNDTEVGLRAPTVSTGAITVQSGYLYMGGYDASTSTFSGSLTAAAGSLVQIDNAGGFIAFTSSSSIDAGDVVFDGSGTDTIAGSYQASGSTTATVSSITFTGEVDSVGALTVWGGTADFSPASSGPVTLALSALNIGGNGILQGTDSFDVAGPFTWSSGRVIGAEGSTLTAESGMSISGILTGRTLINPAGQTATWAGGDFWITDGASFVNAGTFTATGDGYFGWRFGGDLPSFENLGSYTQGGSDVTIAAAFDNSGTVTVQGGTLAMQLGGVSTGSFSAPGGTLNFGGSPTLAASSTIDADQVMFDGGTVAGQYDAHTATVMNGVNGGLAFTGEVDSVGALTVWGGTADFSPASSGPVTLALSALNIGGNGILQGTDSFDVAGPFTWSSGRVIGAEGSTLTAESGMSISGILTGRTLINPAGQTATWAGGDFWITDGASFVNAGTFTATGDGYFGWRFGGDLPSFENLGSYTQGGSDVTIAAAFDNSGTVTVQGGTLAMQLGYTQTSGATILAGGSISSVTPLNIQGGALTGEGTIQGNVINGGQVDPGLGSDLAGTITIQGNYQQTATGSLIVDLDGTVADSGYDQLSVTGNVTLAGALVLRIPSGFMPSDGTVFTLINHTGAGSINGTFADLAEGAILGSACDGYRISYVGGDGNDVTLTASAVMTSLTVETTSNIMLVGNSPPPLTGFINGTPFTGSITITTPCGDQVTVTLVTTATASSPVGQYPITAVLSGPGMDDSFIDLATSHFGTMYVVSVGADPSSSGAQAVTFWDNKGNAKLVTATDLSSLDALNLVTQGGSAFDPRSVAQLQAWLSISPNATAAYRLAVQLAVTDLNILAGDVKATDLVYAGGLLPYATADNIAGLTSGGFIDVQYLIQAANTALGQVSPGAPANDPNAAYELALAQVLQAANGNSDFVQQELAWALLGLYPTLV